MRIENWCYCKGIVPCEPDMTMEGRLHGQVFGNMRFQEGQTITTSRVVRIVNDMIVTFSGSYYELGKPADFYENAFPGCKDKLLGRE